MHGFGSRIYKNVHRVTSPVHKNVHRVTSPVHDLWGAAMQILELEYMSRHTTFRVGGPARLFYIPETEEELADIVAKCNRLELPYTVIGRGSNLLVADRGYLGVVIQIGGLPDCKPDELLWDYAERVQILLIGKPALLESCEAPEIFRLALPASSQAVIGAVEMLSQLHQMRLPKRVGSEKQTVEKAKRLLMHRHGLTEPEAHRALQQYAMNHGMKMADYAAQIVSSSKRTEE